MLSTFLKQFLKPINMKGRKLHPPQLRTYSMDQLVVVGEQLATAADVEEESVEADLQPVHDQSMEAEADLQDQFMEAEADLEPEEESLDIR